jgi:hypothetical protein
VYRQKGHIMRYKLRLAKPRITCHQTTGKCPRELEHALIILVCVGAAGAALFFVPKLFRLPVEPVKNYGYTLHSVGSQLM